MKKLGDQTNTNKQTTRGDSRLNVKVMVLDEHTRLAPKSLVNQFTPFRNFTEGRESLSYGGRSTLGFRLYGAGFTSKIALPTLEEYLQASADLAMRSGIEVALRKQRALIEIYASGIPAPRYNQREAQMIARAQEKVILSTEWVSAAELSDLAGLTSTNKSAGPAKWKSADKIFSVNYLSEELFPIYAIDKQNSFKPHKGLKPILELFAGKKDSWGVAYWFAGSNGYLGGKRPQDLLGSKPDLVLQAAHDELAGVTHG